MPHVAYSPPTWPAVRLLVHRFRQCWELGLEPYFKITGVTARTSHPRRPQRDHGAEFLKILVTPYVVAISREATAHASAQRRTLDKMPRRTMTYALRTPRKSRALYRVGGTRNCSSGEFAGHTIVTWIERILECRSKQCRR